MSLSTEEGLKLAIGGDADLLRVRAALRSEAQHAGLSLTGETKLVTAGSELARNILRYATHRQGTVAIERLDRDGRRGVRVAFSDSGPGIADLDQAMSDGFSTGGSLGLGLPGSRRLVDEFAIESAASGTTVVIAQWSR
jgi:serine/threonine-protein kinase RsbT